MSQLVFIHGPGAGGCREGYAYQLERFPGSLAPNLPGHPEGRSCANVQGYTEWVRGWLWGHDLRDDLVLVGFTLGACIALQYALDYPEEVSGLMLMTVAMRPKERDPGTLEMRLRAAEDPQAHETWLRAMDHAMMFIDPDLRERLLEWHRQVGPISQHDDLVVIDRFDMRDRIHTLQAPLVLIRGIDDPLTSDEYELEIHQAVPGSKYIRLDNAGHFPMAERPDDVNQAIEELLTTLG